MVDRIINRATAVLIGLFLIHGAVIVWVQTGHDIVEPWRGPYLYGLFGFMLAAFVTLIASFVFKRY